MKKLPLLLTAASFAAITSPALAEQFYVGIDVGAANWDHGTKATSGVEEDYLLGGINAGYRFHPNGAVEIGYLRTDKESNNVGSVEVETTLQAVYVDLIGNYEFMPRANILASVGLAYLEAEADVSASSVSTSVADDDTVAKLGVGLSYDLTDKISARTLVNYYDTASEIYTYTAGIQYKF